MRGLFRGPAVALIVVLAPGLAGPLSAQGAGGQGFAGLGAGADGFALPQRGHRFGFPRDHGAHPDFRIEWWYLTANLQGPDGADYGVQWTLFRSALAPGDAPEAGAERRQGWDSPQLWMAHAAVTSARLHRGAERFGRGGIGQAGVTAEPFAAWLDDWRMDSLAPPGEDALSHLAVTARGGDFAFALEARAGGPLVFHGEAGFSQKSASGGASHYYSQPFYRVTGALTLPGEEVGEVQVTGTAWLDREWSSQPLDPGQLGWDWFALVFDDGHRLMAAQLREAGGAGFRFGTWIAPDGRHAALPGAALRLTPLDLAEVAGREMPVRWRVEVPGQGVDVVATAVNPQAWMDTSFAYWEGPVRVAGSHGGRGYLEMTGY